MISIPESGRRVVVLFGLLVWLTACAESSLSQEPERRQDEFDAVLSHRTVVNSSVLSFQFLNTSGRSSTGISIRFRGELDDGRTLDESFYVPAARVGEHGDLVAHLRASDGLFDAVAPGDSTRFTGDVSLELDDALGVFARSDIDPVELTFVDALRPEVEELPQRNRVRIGEALEVQGSGFLRPEEGMTWAITDRAELEYDDGTTRVVSNARVGLEWSGSRTLARMPIRPEIFGVRVGRFSGPIRFENELTTGGVFEGSTFDAYEVEIQPTQIRSVEPPEGSRGQRITIAGNGFLRSNEGRGYGMYLLFEGEFRPADDPSRVESFTGQDAIVRVPYRVASPEIIEQNVWYDIVPGRGLVGLGAAPGTFDGSITPVLFDARGEQPGVAWSGQFRVLPTRQIIHVKFLPGFSSGLEIFGLRNVEEEVRAQVFEILERDYEGINVGFQPTPPGDFIDFTTIEVGGPDPSGLLNFGYDNSFNEGGKDVGNLYLDDYLGGVNRRSQSAGFLPYGGVFVESFIAFSPTLFPDNFGTSRHFDRAFAPFMPGLGGSPVGGDEWPDGPRAAAIENAVRLLGTLVGHTASHEIGHSVGLAYFPPSIEGHERRFHNDPPGEGLIMDAGSERPFEERAEIGGPSTHFSDENRTYLRSILPLP